MKQVIDEDEIKVDQDRQRLITDGVRRKISVFDKNAIEEAVRLREKHGGTVTLLTVSSEDSSKSLKEALAMGCDKAYHVTDSILLDSDNFCTSLILSKAISKIGAFDLIICSEGSSDGYSGQVGPTLSELLDIPLLSYAREVNVSDMKISVKRRMEEGVELLQAKLPALITAVSEINDPRVPTLTQILSSSKKPIVGLTLNELGINQDQLGLKGSSISLVSVKPLVSNRKKIFIKGTMEEISEELSSHLVKDGILG